MCNVPAQLISALVIVTDATGAGAVEVAESPAPVDPVVGSPVAVVVAGASPSVPVVFPGGDVESDGMVVVVSAAEVAVTSVVVVLAVGEATPTARSGTKYSPPPLIPCLKAT